jgi:nucleotide-binding universal stress UspA family protein/hemerythrin-like domain-containing protein
MYRHLLVPIDETDLSTVTIGNAVEFARALGARITFFHAQINYSASFFGDAEVVRVTAPEDFAYSFQGRARELLTKAESAARAQGVTSAVASSVSDSPYRAIIAAATKAKCDLIFMASHGRRSNMGMMLGSQTLKVLMNSEIPVLVSSTKNPPVPALAIGIIRDEHRSLAAVLHAWLHLGNTSLAAGGTPLDHQLLRAMVHYIKAFPVALHHPKETEYLFARLRERTVEFNAELDELDRQHERDHEMVEQLEASVESYCAGKLAVAELDAAVNRYAHFMWEHMGREESVILPAAQRELTAEDWNALSEAFSHNQDPRFGGSTDAEFRHLFSRIVNLVPSPAEK